MTVTRRQSSRLRNLPPRGTPLAAPAAINETEQVVVPFDRESLLRAETPKPARKGRATRGPAMVSENPAEPVQFGQPVATAGSENKNRPCHTTPQKNIGIVPSGTEMHPAHHHQSTASRPDDGLVLGFYPMEENAAGAEPASIEGALAAAQKTPTRSSRRNSEQAFAFTFATDNLPMMSSEQRALMMDLRKKRDVFQGAGVGDNMPTEADEATRQSRMIAHPKAQRGRFSAAHEAQFDRMDSISSHPSLLRRDPVRARPVATPAAKKSLKRTQSKADLVETPSPVKPVRPGPTPATNKRLKSDAGVPVRPGSSIPVLGSTSRPLTSVPPSRPLDRSFKTPIKPTVGRTATGPATPTALSFGKAPLSARAVRSAMASPAVRGSQSVRAVKVGTKSLATLSIQRFPAGSSNIRRPPEKSIVVEVQEASPEPETPSGSRHERPRADDSPPAEPSPSPCKAASARPAFLTGSPLKPVSRLQPPGGSTIKSILRSPSRPGSSHATKPTVRIEGSSPTKLPMPTRPTSMVRAKRVDFSASAIAMADHQERRATSAEPVSVPVKKGTPRPKASSLPPIDESPTPMVAPSFSAGAESPSKDPFSSTFPSRDFTFRFGPGQITFAPTSSPTKTTMVTTPNRAGTGPGGEMDLDQTPSRADRGADTGAASVFYPSLSPMLGGKRKLAAVGASEQTMPKEADKENDRTGSDDQAGARPTKRVRTVEPTTPETQVGGPARQDVLTRTAPVNKPSRRETIRNLIPASARAVRSRLTLDRLNFLATPRQR